MLLSVKEITKIEHKALNVYLYFEMLANSQNLQIAKAFLHSNKNAYVTETSLERKTLSAPSI